MGYDMKLVIIKNKTLQLYEEAYKNLSFSELYLNFMFRTVYPYEWVTTKDYQGRIITDSNKRIFDDFLIRNNIKINTIYCVDNAIIISEETYYKMFNWLESIIKSTTFYDIVNKKIDESLMREYINIYKDMKSQTIDWENEIVVFEYDF